MTYIFWGKPEITNDHLIVNSEKELAFVYLTAALCEKADIKISNINSEALTSIYDDAGIQSNFYGDRLYISKKPLNINGTLIKDFSEYSHFAIPFAIFCAAKGIQADLKGLNSLTKEKANSTIAAFQKEIYCFNINTDFCDFSKLKIFNSKPIHAKSKPVNITDDDALCINLISLAVVFGKIEMELPDNFFEQHTEMNTLLEKLNFSYVKKTLN